MAIKSVLNKVFNYVKNYGKPDPKAPFSSFGLFIGTLIVLFLTWLPVHFGYGWLCVFLIGEYKEAFEYWKYALFSHKD